MSGSFRWQPDRHRVMFSLTRFPAGLSHDDVRLLLMRSDDRLPLDASSMSVETPLTTLESSMDYRREWPMAHHSSPNARHSMDRVNFPLMDRLMEILTPLDELELCWGKPLAELTTFRIGGPVTCVARPVDVRAFGVLMAVVRRENIPHLILGGGSNVLAPDDPWDVLVVRMAAPAGRIERVNPETEAAGEVFAEAGVRLSTLLAYCIRAELGGLEPLVGIPGTVGGAIVMNAGSKDGCIADPLLWIEVMDASGERRRMVREDLRAEYRHMGLPWEVAVLGACFGLHRRAQGLLKERMALLMRKRKQTQPLGLPSAGCIFKNPSGVSAGALIDQAGLKGARIGGAEISRMHANWIVNLGDAKAADILGLIRLEEEEVLARFGIRLEREIRVLGPQAHGVISTTEH